MPRRNMGVNTKKWGPHAWRVLHILGRLMTEQGVVDLLIFRDLQYIVPCIHCRKSFSGFWQNTLRHINDPFELTYVAHTLVNHKLDSQEDTDKRLRTQPSPEEAYRRAPFTNAFYGQLAMLLHYVLRDWTDDRAPHIRAWMRRVGTFLSKVDGARGKRWHTLVRHAIRHHGFINDKCRKQLVASLHNLTHKPNLHKVNRKCDAAISRNCP